MNNGSYQTTLRKELEFAQSYLYLQQRRLGSKLKYSLYMEADIGDTVMLKATIQPLVENFIKHGLDRNKKIGEIKVRCYKAADEIWVDVIDNGKGMAPAREDEVRSSLQNGGKSGSREGAMNNIHERLSIFFGRDYGLEIINNSVEGMRVRLRLPREAADKHGGEQHER
ncbi:putative sensor-like histidine kinase [compost metagenome]